MHRRVSSPRGCALSLLMLAGLAGLAAGTAQASGGYGGGGSVYGIPRSVSPRPESVDTEALAYYNRGKSLYETRMSCADCPLAGVILNEGLARELLFNKRGVLLTHDEIYALDLYLKRRFRL